MSPEVTEKTLECFSCWKVAMKSGCSAAVAAPRVPDVKPFFFRAAALAIAIHSLARADDGAMDRGKKIYEANCLMCHQVAGGGVPPAFPPLAKSDWLMADRERAVIVLAEGLSGKITVNGQEYDGSMPAQMLDDSQVSDVLTFITNSWGNRADPFTPEEVATARLKSRFPTYEKLVRASAYRPLPPAPEGWEIEEMARLNEYPTRFAGHTEDGNTFVLMQKGAVLRLKGKSLFPWLNAKSYLPDDPDIISTMGATIGPSGHLWITSNRRITGQDGMLRNRVDIWRSAAPIDPDQSPEMVSWFRVEMPYGVGPVQPRREPPSFRAGREALRFQRLSHGFRRNGKYR